MNLLRHHSPSADEVQASTDRILASLESHKLDPATTLIMGGSALTLAGIRPASDIDLMVPGTTFNNMQLTMQTPAGLHLRQKPHARQPFLESDPAFPHPVDLAIDITMPTFSNGQWHAELDEQFLREISRFSSIGGYHFLPPEIVAARKAQLNRRKDRRDLKLIAGATENQGK